MPYVPPANITITVEGRDRLWVAAALMDTATQLRSDLTPRKSKTTVGRFAIERANRLWDLAQKVQV